MKGAWRGQAEISSLHANFFINRGRATAAQIYELIRLAQEAYAQKRQTRYNYKTGLVRHAAAKGLKGIKGFKK